MNKRMLNYKQGIYEQFARIGKAISNPRRLELLDLLSQSPRTVEALAREAGMTVASASQHLKVLRSVHLVRAEKNGLFVSYSLADRNVYEFFRRLRTFAENHLAEVEFITRHFLEGKDHMEPVERTEFFNLVKKNAVTILDVRPGPEYRAGHIKGALSIPLRELEDRISELPRDKSVVAYCRGPYCVLAVRAVEILRAEGFDARRFDEGIRDLKAAGFPIRESEED